MAKVKKFNEQADNREKIKVSDITQYDYPEDIKGWTLIDQNQVYFDGEKGYVRYECIFRRNEDGKFFKVSYEDWGRGESSFLEQTAYEVQRKEKIVYYYE